jgi:hypothetical protein
VSCARSARAATRTLVRATDRSWARTRVPPNVRTREHLFGPHNIHCCGRQRMKLPESPSRPARKGTTTPLSEPVPGHERVPPARAGAPQREPAELRRGGGHAAHVGHSGCPPHSQGSQENVSGSTGRGGIARMRATIRRWSNSVRACSTSARMRARRSRVAAAWSARRSSSFPTVRGLTVRSPSATAPTGSRSAGARAPGARARRRHSAARSCRRR